MYAPEEHYSDIAWVKRCLEMASMIPGFHEELTNDVIATLEKYELKNIEPNDICFVARNPENGFACEARYPESRGGEYAKFINSKLEMRDKLLKDNVPVDPAMQKWRLRQVGRCQVELGAKSVGLIHSPFAIEIADGCSVGCEFCGLNAGRLKSVFRYTEENSKLFRDVLEVAREFFGDAAGNGTMYFATEPLDNPDYELFLNDYREILHKTPQITTAASTRNIERTKRLIADLNEHKDIIYRFSVVSLDMAKEIFEAFEPEELLYVELLPQFDEAPGNAFINAGRNGEKHEEYGDTICCMSGFRVNMCRHELVLCTPTYSTNEHPTGEYILDIANFETGEEFRECVIAMIKKHMTNIVMPKDRIKMRDNMEYTYNDDGTILINIRGQMECRLTCEKSAKVYRQAIEELNKGFRTRHEIICDMIKKYGYNSADSQTLSFVINKLWCMGFVETESGKI